MRFLKFVTVCWFAWKATRRGEKLIYVTVSKHGVPSCAMFVGYDREAWRVTQFAMESKLCS